MASRGFARRTEATRALEVLAPGAVVHFLGLGDGVAVECVIHSCSSIRLPILGRGAGPVLPSPAAGVAAAPPGC